ncbi:MAG: D-2-hydroxyacid dehydrogenase [Planctomycetota bacterium]|nr:D-2-hydroxyacid dehydrogenase [Planctomycetota bacterium]
MRIVLCYPVEARHIEQMRATAPQFEVVDAGQQGIAEELAEATIFCGHAKVPVPWHEVVRAGRLKWIQSSAAGLDHCLVPSVVESDICVTSASGVLADQVAEHTLALILASLRSLPEFFRAQNEKEFQRRPTRDIHQATVGIVGFGGVGRRVAEVLAAFKARILATDMYPVDKPDYVDQLWPADQLLSLLKESDIVILCVPLTAVTQGMINADTLNVMKAQALLVNVARGPVVVEADLVDALDRATIAAAALDVTEQEPLAPQSALWDLPNVIITPHVAGQSARRADDMTDFFCRNLVRYQRGQPLLNRVDKRLGYPVRVSP